MDQGTLLAIITDQTQRALWEVKNVIDCIPEELWDKKYCEMPCWKHVYHMLHSLDQWYINPCDIDFKEPEIHVKDLNNLDVISEKHLSRDEIGSYYFAIKAKIEAYLMDLTDEQLLQCPSGCEYSRFALILAQFRHLHSHMGMLMGFIIDDTGLWPRVLGLKRPFPTGEYSKYF